jgi:hypothetical protein
MGGNAGEVDLAIPTVSPGERVTTGDGRTLLVLDASYNLPEESDFRGLLTVEELARE